MRQGEPASSPDFPAHYNLSSKWPVQLLVKSRYYANHYDESLFPLEIVGDYFLAEEEQ